MGLVSWCSDQIEVQSRILSWYSHLNVFSRISTDHKIVTNGVYRNLIISKHHKSHKHILTIIASYLIFGNVHDQLRFDISSISNISHNSGNLSLHMMKTELRHKTFLYILLPFWKSSFFNSVTNLIILFRHILYSYVNVVPEHVSPNYICLVTRHHNRYVN